MNILQVFFRNNFRRGHKSFPLLVIAAVALLLSACGSSSRNLADMPVNVQEYSSEEYQIGVGDQIRIEVWGNERQIGRAHV